ncbi:MAG TPA: permease-like cell division protein FtsX [Acidimicrobiia bacterium]|nr:permease-like cell division protein FtsX [Acidimicrobiia bacterium]
MSRFLYLLRDALVNLRRNALVVSGAVLAVLVSMSLALGALMVNELVRVNLIQWQEGTHVIVFLKDEQAGVTRASQRALRAEIERWPQVESTEFYDKSDALEEFRQIFAEQPALLEEIDPALLPASIRIRLHDIADYRQVEFQLAGEAPVRRVRSLGERIDELSAVSNVLNGLGLVASLVLGVSAVVLIANTIRMAIYARRDEVSIMKLVGAGNWFIRVPFVLEGLIEGVVGAGLAVLAVWLASDRLASVEQSVEIVRLSLPTDFFLRWGVLFVLFGAAAGVLGSLLGLRRFLRV